ncbi:MAG: DUF542 domain-containing protein, partial [Arenibacter latericius]|nr:DUF542 domain-containing protein [Arenibacter latericius]
MSKPIGEIVADNYKTAQVFKSHKIDFCCKGNRSVLEVAEKNKLDANLLLKELQSVQQQTHGDQIDFTAWPLDLLA